MNQPFWATVGLATMILIDGRFDATKKPPALEIEYGWLRMLSVDA